MSFHPARAWSYYASQHKDIMSVINHSRYFISTHFMIFFPPPVADILLIKNDSSGVSPVMPCGVLSCMWSCFLLSVCRDVQNQALKGINRAENMREYNKMSLDSR